MFDFLHVIYMFRCLHVYVVVMSFSYTPSV